MNNYTSARNTNYGFMILIFISFIFCSLSYLPSLTGVYTFMNEQSEMRNYLSYASLSILILFLLCRVQNVLDAFLKFRINKIFLFSSILAVAYILVNPEVILQDSYMTTSSFMFLFAGTSVISDSRTIRMLFIVYSIIVLYIALQTVFAFGLSLEISDTYIVTNKNSLCVMWAICATGLFYFAVSKRVGLFEFFLLALSVCFIVLILVSRARGAFLGCSVSIFFILIKRFSTFTPMRLFILIFLGIVFAFIALLFVRNFLGGIGDFIFQSITGGKDVTNLDSLSSGRMTRNIIAIQEFIKNPLFGLLYFNGRIPLVHNYPLRVLSSMGLVIGIPFIIMYVTGLVYLLKGIFYNNSMNKLPTWELGYHLCMVLYVISMVEILAPFGPGTISALPFFFFGMAIRGKTEDEQMVNMSLRTGIPYTPLQ